MQVTHAGPCHSDLQCVARFLSGADSVCCTEGLRGCDRVPFLSRFCYRKWKQPSTFVLCKPPTPHRQEILKILRYSKRASRRGDASSRQAGRSQTVAGAGLCTMRPTAPVPLGCHVHCTVVSESPLFRPSLRQSQSVPGKGPLLTATTALMMAMGGEGCSGWQLSVGGGGSANS